MLPRGITKESQSCILVLASKLKGQDEEAMESEQLQGYSK